MISISPTTIHESRVLVSRFVSSATISIHEIIEVNGALARGFGVSTGEAGLSDGVPGLPEP